MTADGTEHSEGSNVEFDAPAYMPRKSSKAREVLKEYLRARRAAGFSYVSSDDIRRDLDWNPMPQKIGSNLRELDNEGVVEKWSDGAVANYRILIGEDGADDR